MSDFLDRLPAVDNLVDQHLGDSATLAHDGQVFNIRGPFDKETFVNSDGQTSTVTQIATYSVQARHVPDDPRNGVLVVRGERFLVVDFEPSDDGRIVLMLDKYNAPS